MYLEFYKLMEFPFATTCDAKFFFESPAHAEALANMLYTIQQRKGMVLITGEVGSGKTFLGSMLGARLGAGCLAAMLKNPPQTGDQLLRAVAARLDMDAPAPDDRPGLLAALEDQLIRLLNRGRLVALVFDEAQDLTAPALEELRRLWNWERDGQRLAQIVVIGQPDLRAKLLEPQWEALRQRIALSYHLGPLSASDTADYVAHRLRVAGDKRPNARFTPEALAAVHAATDGIPRLINTVCDNALLVGYAKGMRTITDGLVTGVIREMTCWGLRTPSRLPDAHGP
jgi:general secretion pathway protein A